MKQGSGQRTRFWKPVYLVYVFLLVWALSEIFPLFWMTYSSFKTTAEIYRDIWALPSILRLNNYYDDIAGQVTSSIVIPVGQFLVNSSIVAFASVLGIIMVSVPAGYALSKKSRWSDILFYLFLAMIAIPSSSVLIPLYYTVKSLGLANTYLGLILPYVAFNIPFSIVLARAFFKLFPKELEEAARIDGLSDLGVFVRIVFPLSTVIVIVLAIVNFPNVWNELLFAVVLVQTNGAKTIQPGLLLFTSAYRVEWGNIFAGLVLSSLPMIIFYIIFQRYIVKAVFLGAIKG